MEYGFKKTKFLAAVSLQIIVFVLGALLTFASDRQNTFYHEIVASERAMRLEHARELVGDHRIHQILTEDQINSLPTVRVLVRRAMTKASAELVEKVAVAVTEESARHRFDPIFLLAVIQRESRFNPLARGAHGEIGLMQLRPATAEWIANKYRFGWAGDKSLENPRLNIRLGAAYLDMLRKKFNSSGGIYLSAYNMGPRRTRQLLNENTIPRIYADEVVQNYLRFHTDAKGLAADRG